MDDLSRPEPRRKRLPKPLNSSTLQEMALSYAARFSTSAAKLETYLKRKLRERGWDDEGQPDTAALVDRLVELRYVDDEAYARAKSGSLLRRGYGERRVSQALGAAGISENLREDIRASEIEQRRAAVALARKRRFGPFAIDPPDRDRREKQLAAMLRAGHPLDKARRILDMPNEEEAETWVDEAEEWEL